MPLETYVSIDIHNALANLNNLAKAAAPLKNISMAVTLPGVQEGITALDNLKTRLTQIKALSGDALKVKVDISGVKEQADNAIAQLRKLQTAARAMNGGQNKINIQAVVTDALQNMQRVLDMIRQLRAQSTIKINVQVNGGEAGSEIEDVHARLSQLNGSGVQWSATQEQAAASGAHWSSGLGDIYSNLVMVGRALSSVAVVTRTLEAGYHFLFDFSNTLAQTKVGFTTLFDGNQAKADKLLNTLKQFAIPTPFKMVDLAPLAQQAIAFGLVDKNSKTLGKDLVALFTNVGNAAYGLGKGTEGVNTIISALGKMEVDGRVTSRTMLELSTMGVNAWKYLSEATGQSTAEVRKMVEQGLIPAQAAIKAIQEGMGQDFGGGMALGAKTLEGAFSQLSDTLDNLKDKALLGVFDDLTKAMDNLAAIVGTNAFEQWITGVEGKFSEGFAFITGYIESFLDEIRLMEPVILPILTVVGAKFLLFGAQSVAAGIGSAIAAIGKFITFLGPQLTLAIILIGAFVIAYQKNFLGIRTFTDGTVVFVLTALKALVHGVEWVIGELSAGIQKTIGWIQKIPNSVLVAMGPAGSAMMALKQFGPSIAEALDFTNLEVDSDKMFDNIIAGFKNQGGAGGVLTNATKPFMDAINKSLGSLNPFSGFGDMLKKAQAEAAAAQGASGGKSAGPQAGEIPTNDAGTAKLKKNLEDAAKYWDNYAKAVETAADRQINALKGVADSITSLVDSLKNDLIKGGVLNDPLQPAVTKLMQDMNLHGQAMGIATGAAQRVQFASDQAAGYRTQANAISKSNPAGSGAGTANATAALIKQIGDSVQSGAPAASCAYTASKILQAIGVKIPTTDGAKALRDKVLAMGAVQIPLSQAQPGDLVVQSGAGFGAQKYGGIGYHTTISEGGGKVFSSSGRQTQIYSPHNGNPVAYDTSALAKGGSILMGSATSVAQAAQAQVDRTQQTADAIKTLLQNAAAVSSRGSKLFAVPQQWMYAGGGKAVTDAPGNSARFQIQQWLTTQEGHDWFTSQAAKTPGGGMAVATKLRSDANNIDVLKNAASVKIATDATDAFVKQQTDATNALQAGDKWLQNNAYNSIEYGKVMDEAAAKAKAWADVNKNGIPNTQRAALANKEIAASLDLINEKLKNTANINVASAIAKLNQDYGAIGLTTIQQKATYQVQSQEDYQYMDPAKAQEQINDIIRNTQKQYATDQTIGASQQILKMQSDLAAKMGNFDPGQQLQAQFDLSDKLYKEFTDPTWTASWELTQQRAQEIALAIQSWDFDTQKDKLKEFNDAMADASLTAKGAQKLIDKNTQDAEDANNPGAIFGTDMTQPLLGHGSQDDAQKLTSQINDFAQQYNQQVEDVLDTGHAVSQTQKQIDSFRVALQDAEAVAQKNGVWDQVKDQFNGIAAALNNIDPQRMVAAEDAARVNKALTGINTDIDLAKILDPAKADFVKWKQGLLSDGFTDADVQLLVPAYRIQQQVNQTREYLNTLINGIQSSLQNAFQNLFEQGPAHFFSNLINGLAKTLDQMTTQIITSTAMKYLTQLLNGTFGGGNGGSSSLGSILGGGGGSSTLDSLLNLGGSLLTGSITSGMGQSGFNSGGGSFGGDSVTSGFDFSGMSNGLALATGMPTVPYDGLPAILHKNEAVLTASQAQDWRQQQRDMARMPSSGSSQNQAAGGITVVNQYTIGQVVANDPQQFTGKLPTTPTSTREVQRSIAIAANKGNRRL